MSANGAPAGSALPQFVCASANPGKVAEIQALLVGLVDLVPRPDAVPDVVEDAPTLLGNARLKAEAISEATGLPAISDDTGLGVAALGGAPGVTTARYAGADASDADNRAKMLREMTDVDDRSAAFTTVAMVCWPDGRELSVEGVCSGMIATEERGDAGFGYDSIFLPAEGDGRSFAEMSTQEKQAISHRGRAFRALLDALEVSPPRDLDRCHGHHEGEMVAPRWLEVDQVGHGERIVGERVVEPHERGNRFVGRPRGRPSPARRDVCVGQSEVEQISVSGMPERCVEVTDHEGGSR